MTKRNLALKQTSSRKPAAKAHRANQSVVKSPKPRHLRSVAPTSAQSSPKVHRPDAPVLAEAKAAMAATKKLPIASENDRQRTMGENDVTKVWNIFSPMSNIGAYQKMLWKIAQSQMKLGFELAQSFARIKSPFEFASIVSRTYDEAICAGSESPGHLSVSAITGESSR